MTDDLESTLRALSTRLDVPPAPDETAVTAAVLARLDEEPVQVTRVRPLQRVIAVVVAALIALVTAMVVSPAVRAAVYDFFSIGGVEIHENQPAPVTPSLDPTLPGERDVSLSEARAQASFPLELPAALGKPTNVRLSDGKPPRVVSMAFGTATGTVRIDQFEGGLGPMFAKFTMTEDVHQVHVDDLPAIWVDRPHVVIYTDRDGVMRESSARLSGSTLIWESAGITYRVEGDLTQDQAIAIARSLR